MPVLAGSGADVYNSQVLRGADCDEVELERDDAGEEAQGERGVQGAPVRVRSQI